MENVLPLHQIKQTGCHPERSLAQFSPNGVEGPAFLSFLEPIQRVARLSHYALTARLLAARFLATRTLAAS
jgi:hypothetical protein